MFDLLTWMREVAFERDVLRPMPKFRVDLRVYDTVRISVTWHRSAGGYVWCETLIFDPVGAYFAHADPRPANLSVARSELSVMSIAYALTYRTRADVLRMVHGAAQRSLQKAWDSFTGYATSEDGKSAYRRDFRPCPVLECSAA